MEGFVPRLLVLLMSMIDDLTTELQTDMVESEERKMKQRAERAAHKEHNKGEQDHDHAEVEHEEKDHDHSHDQEHSQPRKPKPTKDDHHSAPTRASQNRAPPTVEHKVTKTPVEVKK